MVLNKHSFARGLSAAYPKEVMVICLFVQAFSCVINPQVYDFRELVILLVWIPLISIPFKSTKNKWASRIPFFLFCIDGSVTLAHHLLVKGPLTASSLFVFLNSNMNEATEFMELKFNSWWILIIPFAWLLFRTKHRQWSFEHNKSHLLGLSIPFLFASIFVTENYVNERLVRKGIPQNIEAFVSFSEEMESFQRMKKRSIQKVQAESKIESEKKQLIILVIGESCSKNHMSLYGYQRKTNPLLEKRNDITVFTDAISPYLTTIRAVLSLMTEINVYNKMPFDSAISILDVLHSAGFSTHWISNQSPIGVWDNAIFNLAQTADQTNFENKNGNSSFEATYVPSYDEVLFAPLENKIRTNKLQQKTFIGIQLLGSHSAYEKRYPSSFVVFSGGKDRKQQTIDHYDNSIVYNDYVVNHMIEEAKNAAARDSNLLVSLIYLSDHGENVFDSGDYAGHDWTGSIPKVIPEIPLVVWLSPSFKNKFPQKSKAVESNKNRPFSNDDSFHSVLDLANIRFSGFDSTRSVLSPLYAPPRRMLEDGTFRDP
jgi:heptose-I-phosphate ethanolaminephosphotransferase